MVPDGDTSLGEDIVSRWKAELHSLDTVVSGAAVVIAVPLGLAVAMVADYGLAYAVWFAAGVGPGLSVDDLALDGWRRAAALGVALAGINAGVATAAYLGATAAGAPESAVIGAGAIAGLLAGELLVRRGLPAEMYRTGS